MGPDSELVEVVDIAGAVIDIVPRHRMRAEKLRHRCTYVAVVQGPADTDLTAVFRADSSLRADSLVNAETLLVVHQRADWKDTYPSYWDVAFGGVCGVGEEWQTSAERELAEEAGIDGATLHELGPTSYEADDNRVIGRLYIAAWPAEPVCTDGEVVAIDHVPLGELQSWAETVAICPDSAAVVIPALLRLIA
ncbi:MAG: NUDIX domain-containing protein [Acidimicrobiales bacterium]